ncbi:MAG: hypothetical protein ACTHJ0_09950 [Flavipsychrobacter sp.]
MTFSENLINKLQPIIDEYHLLVKNMENDSVNLLSDHVKINIVYNKREESNTLWIGPNNDHDFGAEIDNSILKDVFHTNIELGNVSNSVFIDNLLLFFRQEGNKLFTDNSRKIDQLIQYNEIKNQNYTNDLITKQQLALADQSWAKQDYRSFISFLEKIDKLRLPQSYYLKYKMALKKLKG